MFDAGKLLGQVLRGAASGAIGARRRPARRRPSLPGMSTRGLETKVGLGLIGLAVAAFEHFRQSAATGSPATSPPPRCSPSSGRATSQS